MKYAIIYFKEYIIEFVIKIDFIIEQNIIL